MQRSDPATARVRLYTRTECHLCVEAHADLERICADVGVVFEEFDVDTDATLRAEYGDRVPVILVDGQEFGYFRVDEPRLRDALR